MELSSNNSCYKKCKILSDQCLMLVFKFPIIIFIFTYSICHIRHKLTVTYFIKLDAVIFLSCVVIQKKLSSILTSFNRVFLQCIHFQIFRENSSHTYFFKKGKFSDVTYVRLFKIATMITWKTLDFTLLILFF